MSIKRFKKIKLWFERIVASPTIKRDLIEFTIDLESVTFHLTIQFHIDRIALIIK